MHRLLAPIVEYQRSATGGTWTRRRGARIDLHCHSTFSRETTRWVPGLAFRGLLEPAELYDLAKARGMDFVTITDHDTIDGCKALLDERGPLPDFIVGEELTTRFPEDGLVVHINVYDIDEREHAELQRLRPNLYDVVDFLRRAGRLYVLNHMTWTAQYRPLKTWQIERMLELFPVFEALNGTRRYAQNAFVWYATRGHAKVLVAGSDSHTHRVGRTYTFSAGATKAELLANLRAGRAEPCGAFGTPEQLRDDVWLILHKTLERHIAEASSAWQRWSCRLARRLGQLTYPYVCLGYDACQNLLMRRSLRAIPV